MLTRSCMGGGDVKAASRASREVAKKNGKSDGSRLSGPTAHTLLREKRAKSVAFFRSEFKEGAGKYCAHNDVVKGAGVCHMALL